MKRVADFRGGHLALVLGVVDLIDDLGGEAELHAVAPERFRIAHPVVAVAKIKSDGDVLHAEAIDENVFHELFVGHVRECAVEADFVQHDDAEIGERAGALARRL